MNICIYGASSAEIDPVFLETSEQFGRLIAKRGHTLYFGGGDSGVMGAAARGVRAEGGKMVSVVPSFFNVDGVLYPHADQIIYTDTMSARKQFLEKESDAFAALPGGIGTYDELFECITDKSLGIHNKPIAILNTAHYYDIISRLLEHTIEYKFMKPECRSLYRFFEDGADLISYFENYIPQENENSFFKGD